MPRIWRICVTRTSQDAHLSEQRYANMHRRVDCTHIACTVESTTPHFSHSLPTSKTHCSAPPSPRRPCASEAGHELPKTSSKTLRNEPIQVWMISQSTGRRTGCGRRRPKVRRGCALLNRGTAPAVSTFASALGPLPPTPASVRRDCPIRRNLVMAAAPPLIKTPVHFRVHRCFVSSSQRTRR